MLQVNPGTVVLLLAALIGVAWASGLLRISTEEGLLRIRMPRTSLSLTFDLRDTWLLLGLGLVLGWAVAAAVEHSAWTPGSDGRLVPAFALAALLGWIFIAAGISRAGYVLASILTTIVGIALITPSPLTGGGFSLDAMRKWVADLPGDTNLVLLMGLVLMFLVTGLWTSWWLFKRRNGLVALLPSGTILAVEIINDVSAGLVFYTLVWLAAAASVLLRLNFVALKDSWRRRRLPHASDTGWTFGEIGVEATVAILVLAFIAPPLSSVDISGILIPGIVRPDNFHPFGIGAPGNGGGNIGTVGYSEVVRPGTQLTAKSEVVMVVTGDTPTYSPYWRGIALAGWDGYQWYSIPSTGSEPIRQQPVVAAGSTVPRDDLPTDTSKLDVYHDTIRVEVPDPTRTVFSGGELLSVRNQPITVRGVMTSVPPVSLGPTPALVNVRGDNAPIATFDTIDRVQLARSPQAPYSYTVTSAVPSVEDVADLEAAGSDYPSWLDPYLSLYYQGRIDPRYGKGRDSDIAALAESIVQQAHASTPYDQAKAIESWFLTPKRFTYTLKPPATPKGQRALDYFLFTSRRGFCQDFSSAMNVMLRMLGIPSRQMIGYALGAYDPKTREYTVNSTDAHSWVEVYFPGYGWIPFEPTPDGTNAPVNRPATKADLALLPVPSETARTRVPPNLRETAPQGGGGVINNSPIPDIAHGLLIAAAVIAGLALLALMFATRWLMAARDLPRIWRRLTFLADRLKVPRHRGDTPQEFGERMASSLPELDIELRRLATLYTRASFRRGGLTTDELAEARRVWSRVRSRYAGLVAGAWREALRNGRVVSAEEVEASESRAPSRRR